LLRAIFFQLYCCGEQADETGAVISGRRIGIIAGWLDREILSNSAPGNGGCSTNETLKMQEINFDATLENILARDSRYSHEAYVFVRESLDFTQKLIGKENRGTVRHVTGQELLDGIRQLALQQFGPMVVTVFEDWGIRNCRDFGEIVFNMVEASLLAKTDKDTRDDFQNGYDFTDAFRKPFWPQGKLTAEKVTPE
jgi:uncharacterized repeat protein (TIGR04138 family)